MGTANPLAKSRSASPAQGYLWYRIPNSFGVSVMCVLSGEGFLSCPGYQVVLGGAGFGTGCGEWLPGFGASSQFRVFAGSACSEMTRSRNCYGSFIGHVMLSVLTKITLVSIVCFRKHKWH